MNELFFFQIGSIRHPVVNHDVGNLLFDMDNDPGQQRPIRDEAIRKMMSDHFVRLMEENDAPSEQYERLGLV